MSSNNYEFLSNVRNNTPQSEAIPGREVEMTKNLAGGFAFNANEWTALRRWLCVGSISNAFYAKKRDLMKDNMDFATKLVAQDPDTFANEVVYASNKGLSNSTPLLALVLLSNGTDKKAKTAFLETFNQVVRTASHLYEFLNYASALRGFGRVIKTAVHNWFDNLGASQLAYQLLKYQSRSGWSHRDVLRKFHVQPASTDHNSLYGWCVNGTLESSEFAGTEEDALRQIFWTEHIKANSGNQEQVLRAIREGNLTHEMVTGNVVSMNNAIRKEVFRRMPMTATIRNLGSMTHHGVLSFSDTEMLDVLEERLCNKEALRKARVHPLVLANAYRTYMAGGAFGKSKLSWDAVPRVNNILEEAVNLSFDALEPTGLRFQYNLDVSRSMWFNRGIGNLNLKPGEVAGIMALASVKSEKNTFVGGFDTSFSPLAMYKSTTFRDTMNQNSSVWPNNFGGTDASQGYLDATRNNRVVDVFVSLTDNMTWAGGRNHPTQALEEYRRKVNKNAKAVYVTIDPGYSDRITLVDPSDPRSTDLAGFSADSVRYISMFATGDLDVSVVDS